MFKPLPGHQTWSLPEMTPAPGHRMESGARGGVCSGLVRTFLGITCVVDIRRQPIIMSSAFSATVLCARNAKIILLYALAIFFGVLLVIDIIHLASGGEYTETPYGRENPMISLLGFCSSQITLTMSFVGIAFLLLNASNIAQCAQTLDQLLATFRHCCPVASITAERNYTLKYLLFFFVSGLARFACAAAEPDVIQGFFNETTYVFLRLPSGPVKLYSEVSILAAMLLYIPVTAIFTYFCSILVCCLQAFRAENEGLLRAVDPAFTRQPNGNQQSGRDLTMKGHEYGNQSGGDLTMKSHEHGNQLGGAISTEEFVARLKTLRIHHEAINDTYDQLQMTFGLKLLLDIVTNVFAVLSVIAWFSMWSVNSELANAETGGWNGVSLAIYVATLWLVCNRPLLLQSKHGKMVDEIEKVLYRRQMVKNMKPSREEISITFALRQRLKTKILSFSAGGVLDIHGMAVSLVAGLAGFVAFIMERIEDFKAHAESNQSAKLLETGQTVNVTCSDH